MEVTGGKLVGGGGGCIPLRVNIPLSVNIPLGGNTFFAACYCDVARKKNIENDESFISSISCYVLIKDLFTKSLSHVQMKKNRNKALSKLLALSNVY